MMHPVRGCEIRDTLEPLRGDGPAQSDAENHVCRRVAEMLAGHSEEGETVLSLKGDLAPGDTQLEGPPALHNLQEPGSPALNLSSLPGPRKQPASVVSMLRGDFGGADSTRSIG